MIICHAKYCKNLIWDGTNDVCGLEVTIINDKASCHNFDTKPRRLVKSVKIC